MLGLPAPDAEQQAIIDVIKTGENVIVNAVAGSGKTTTTLNFALQNPDINILLITYNAFLRHETIVRLAKYNIENIEAHTYHSCATKYYTLCINDGDMKKIINNNLQPLMHIHHNIIIIDETQDQCPDYYKFLRKLCNDSGNKFQIIIMGDENQVVYKVRQADCRFLKLANKIWSDFGEFTQMHLKTSYRLTKQIAKFINKFMLGENRIVATKNGPSVKYLHCNAFKNPILWLRDIFNERKYKPDDIFILAPSLKGNQSPVKKLENLIVEYNENHPENKYLVNYPPSDNSELKSKDIEGKIVFSTFNSSKGRERKLVILFSFDESYYKYNAKNEDPRRCPDVFYVAASRAIEELIVIHHNQNNRIPFLKHNPYIRSKYLEYHSYGIGNSNFNDLNRSYDNFIITSPTKLIDYLPSDYLSYLDNIFNSLFITINKAEELIELPINVNRSHGNESVACINGIIIPTIVESEYNANKITAIHRRLLEYQDHESADIMKEAIQKIKEKPQCDTIADFSYLCTVYYSLRDNIHHKLSQLDNQYDWLDAKDVAKCIERVKAVITDNIDLEFEYKISLEDYTNDVFPKIKIYAFIDCIYKNCVREIKCVKKLETEHKLQLVIYAWLYKLCSNKYNKDTTFELFNICTNERLQIDNTKRDIIDEIIYKLLLTKYKIEEISDDTEFITKMSSNFIS
jgi:superfamily I DNA/RNA helicase